MPKTRHLFAPTGAPLKVQGAYKGMWPAPVYVATFADGTVGRHSFYSQAGKPLDFERGRNGACWLWRKGTHPVGSEKIETESECGHCHGTGKLCNSEAFRNVSPDKDCFMCHGAGRRSIKQWVTTNDAGERYQAHAYHNTPARNDIVSGHIEHDGQSFPDPHFSGNVVPMKPKADPVAALLAKIGKLDWEALEAIQNAIDQRLAA